MILILFSIFVAFAFIWYLRRDDGGKGFKKLPGPKGWPLVGNALQMDKLIYKSFNKWSEQYGDLYTCRLGPNKCVLVSNPKYLKELFLNETNYIARPTMDGMDLYEDEKLGIINTSGELWEVHRRFLLRNLRDFGFGKSVMENLIIEEVNEVIQRFKKSEGKPVTDIKKVLTLATVNSLWSIIAQTRFSHDDPKLMALVDNTAKAMEDLTGNPKVVLIMTLPWLRYVAPELSGYNDLRKLFSVQRGWYEEQVEEHKKNFDENNLKDFIDVYLSEMKKTTDPNSVFYGAKAERQLVNILSDLFFAGSDTTSSTLSWAILYLCKYPEAQKKFQDEIEKITDNSRSVSVADKPEMPYTMALIDEIFRRSSIVPDGVQHMAIEGKDFRGYWIPKGAWVMPNLFYIHHDPKLWDEPYSFKPERFLDSEGKYKKSENLFPFQLGRRSCVGETLARDTIFLFLTNIFQRFTIQLDPNEEDPGFEPKLGSFILQPHMYSIIVTDRK